MCVNWFLWNKKRNQTKLSVVYMKLCWISVFLKPYSAYRRINYLDLLREEGGGGCIQNKFYFQGCENDKCFSEILIFIEQGVSFWHKTAFFICVLLEIRCRKDGQIIFLTGSWLWTYTKNWFHKSMLSLQEFITLNVDFRTYFMFLRYHCKVYLFDLEILFFFGDLVLIFIVKNLWKIYYLKNNNNKRIQVKFDMHKYDKSKIKKKQISFSLL